MAFDPISIIVQLVIAVVMMAVSYAILPRPKRDKPEATTDIEAPTAEAGRPIPVVFGTLTLTGPNILWRGDKYLLHRTPYGRPIFQVFMSMHFGLCHGTVDALWRIRIHDKAAWEGLLTTGGSFPIYQDYLFGGHEGEGGCGGQVYWRSGKAEQTLNPDCIAGMVRNGASEDRIPGYRGIANCFFMGHPGFEWQGRPIYGFWWIENTPYLPPVDFTITRIDRSWQPAIAPIGGDPLLTGEPEPRGYTYLYGASGSVSVRIRINWADDFIYVLHEESPWVFEIHKYQRSTLTLVDTATVAEVSDPDVPNFYVNWAVGGEAIYMQVKPGAPDDDFLLRIDPATLTETHRSPTDFAPYFPSASRFWIQNLVVVNALNGKPFVLAAVEATTDSTSLVIFDGDTCAWVAGLYWPFASHHFHLALIAADNGVGYALDCDWLGSTANDITFYKVALTGLEVYSGGSTSGFSGFNVVGTLAPADISAAYAGTNARFDSLSAVPFAAYDHADPGLILAVVVTPESGPAEKWFLRWEEGIGVVWARRDTEIVPSETVVSGGTSHVAGEFYLLGTTSKDLYLVRTSDGELLQTVDVTELQVNPAAANWSYNSATGQVVLASTILNLELVTFDPAPGSPGTGDWPDMNPAHIIRECLVNRSWGLGLPVSVIDDASFFAAAQRLYDEEFGLSMIWTRQTKVEEFIREVQDHIEAVVYVAPDTGLYTIKLIRDDYDPEILPVYGPENCIVTSFQRRTPAEIVNEIQVTWTNPENEKEEVVTVQNLGAIVALNGEIASDNRNFYGVRRRNLAARLAARDLSAASAPLVLAEIVVDRRAWALAPADVIKLEWPEFGLPETVMRVLSVNYGRPGDSAITVNLSEDIFAFTKPAPIDPPETESPPISSAPETPTVEALTAPYYFAEAAGLPAAGATEGYVAVLVATDVLDTDSVRIEAEEPGTTGTAGYVDIGSFPVVGQAQINEAWAAEAVTVAGVPLAVNYLAGGGPEAGGFALVGPPGLPETEQEIVLFVSNASGAWTIRRGALDTVPQAWPQFTPIRFLGAGLPGLDPTAREIEEVVDYRVRTRTSEGLLPLGQAGLLSHAPTDRYYAPLRPADAKVGTTGFGTYDASAGGDVPVTWANRNRLTEEQTVLAWTAASVTPETGQTTVLTILDPSDGSTVATISGLTGTSHSIPRATFGTLTQAVVRFTAERDGIESIQGHEVGVKLIAGYGFGYGQSYGG